MHGQYSGILQFLVTRQLQLQRWLAFWPPFPGVWFQPSPPPPSSRTPPPQSSPPSPPSSPPPLPLTGPGRKATQELEPWIQMDLQPGPELSCIKENLSRSGGLKFSSIPSAIFVPNYCNSSGGTGMALVHTNIGITTTQGI